MTTDLNVIAMRYMFEKHGTLPLEYIELDEYSKGMITAFLEDICEVAMKQRKDLEAESKRVRRR